MRMLARQLVDGQRRNLHGQTDLDDSVLRRTGTARSHLAALEQPHFGIERPIERAVAALAVVRADPVDQLLIAELSVVTPAVVDVATIDLAMPQNALLGVQSHVK